MLEALADVLYDPHRVGLGLLVEVLSHIQGPGGDMHAPGRVADALLPARLLGAGAAERRLELALGPLDPLVQHQGRLAGHSPQGVIGEHASRRLGDEVGEVLEVARHDDVHLIGELEPGVGGQQLARVLDPGHGRVLGLHLLDR